MYLIYEIQCHENGKSYIGTGPLLSQSSKLIVRKADKKPTN